MEKAMHRITETSRIPQTKIQKRKGEISAHSYQILNKYANRVSTDIDTEESAHVVPTKKDRLANTAGGV